MSRMLVKRVKKPGLLPTIERMTPFPADCNPMHHDAFHMGVYVSGSWMALHAQHAGVNQHTGERFPDPDYIIMVNSRTGQRFKLKFPKVTPEQVAAEQETLDRIKEHAEEK